MTIRARSVFGITGVMWFLLSCGTLLAQEQTGQGHEVVSNRAQEEVRRAQNFDFSLPAAQNLINSSQQLQTNRGLSAQRFIPRSTTGFFWEHVGFQRWRLMLYVKDYPVHVPAIKITIYWNLKSYIKLYDDGTDVIVGSAVEDFSLPGLNVDTPTMLRGYNVFSDGSLRLAYFGTTINARSPQPKNTFQPRSEPYEIGSFKFVRGNSYFNWLNNPLLYGHSVVQVIGTSDSLASGITYNRPGLHFVDGNDDNLQNISDYLLLWDFLNNFPGPINFSLFQSVFDPRFDINEDAWMNFIDLRTLGARINGGNYISDVNGDGVADQADLNLIESHLGDALLTDDGGFNPFYFWQADINADLVIDGRDLIEAQKEVDQNKVYY